MFKRFLLKRLLPFITSIIVVDIDTVQRPGGKYLRIRVEESVFGTKLLDRRLQLSDAKESVIDERLTNN